MSRKPFPLLKRFAVFNVVQCDNLPDHLFERHEDHHGLLFPRMLEKRLKRGGRNSASTAAMSVTSTSSTNGRKAIAGRSRERFRAGR